MTDMINLTAREIAREIRARSFSAREILSRCLDYIEETDQDLGAFLHLDRQCSMERALEVDRLLDRGSDPGPLAGVPVALKDNLSYPGWPTTCGSKILDGYIPPYAATAAARLKQAGAVFVGKTNLDEFSMGSSTENSAYRVTRNPWDRTRVPGGSSGGSAASVAARQVPLALGSDTGGSIRQPASFCGTTGMKPTYGRVSRYGLVAFASSLDQIGPFGVDVADCALALEVIAGRDPLDSTSASEPVETWSRDLPGDLKGLRIGVVSEHLGGGTEPGVRDRVAQAVEHLEGLGAEVGEVSLPHVSHGLSAYYLIAAAECSSNLARYDGVVFGPRAAGKGWTDIISRTRGEGFGPEVRRRLVLGTYALSAGYYDAYYLKASRVRTLIIQDFDRAFERFDVMVGPTAPSVAFARGERVDDPLAMYASDVLTCPVNLAGLPALSVPCGFSQGMPVGLQVIGPAFKDGLVMKVGRAYQENTDHHTRVPAGAERGDGDGR